MLVKQLKTVLRCFFSSDAFLPIEASTIPLQNTLDQLLASIKITESVYYWVLVISPEIEFEIHLKRSTSSSFVNNYNPVLMKAWEANLDIQPVLIYYK